MSKKEVGSGKLGAFKGVFIPTFLTVVGVILFLRLGYIVGEGGILGTLAVILLAISVTFSTGLALSSIITNIRVGSGGAYSIISKTLGLEIGGSVGIPLFLAQVFSVALYIFGFTETWKYIFPSHPRLLVVFASFLILFLLTFISTKIAVKTQVVVFFLMIASLVSVFVAGNWWQGISMPSLSGFPVDNFWVLFALFFPAATGLMAGIGMSGELSDPKSQIPKGVISALIVSTLIYVLMIFFFSYSASAEALLNNNLIIIDLAAFGPLVLAGILASTFSSALTTLLAAPRILQALGANSILPFSAFFSKKSEKGEPRNAVLATGLVVAIALTLGNLNTIAPVLTMFFLITYAVINLAVFLEQSLGLIGFRPMFRIPKWVSLYGFVASIIFILYINLMAGFLASLVLVTVYLYLVKKHLKQKKGDVRSGLFFAISEWAARKVNKLAESREHIWRPHICLPVRSPKTVYSRHHLLKAMLSPKGTISILDMSSKEKEREKIRREEKRFYEEGIYTNYTTVEDKDYIKSIEIALEAIEGQFFHPNVAYVPSDISKLSEDNLKGLINSCDYSETGLMFFKPSQNTTIEENQEIHLWVPEKALNKDFYENRSFDLAMLLSYKMRMNWSGKIILHMSLNNNSKIKAKRYLNRLVYEARFPKNTEVDVSTIAKERKFKERDGELHIVPFENYRDIEREEKKTEGTNNSYIFLKDSGEEDVLA